MNIQSMGESPYEGPDPQNDKLNTNQERFKILSYDDVLPTPVRDCREALVSISEKIPEIVCEYQKEGLSEKYGNNMYAREGVVERLASVQESLQAGKYFPAGSKLLVAYAYRYLSDQTKWFNEAKERIKKENPELTEKEVVLAANMQVAAPEVAGHPTGAAVDVTILLPDGSFADMGSGIADFSDPEMYPTLSESITTQQQLNRIALQDLMVEAGFAPFNGEWWHFSYGDKEWATYTKAKEAMYGPIELKP